MSVALAALAAACAAPAETPVCDWEALGVPAPTAQPEESEPARDAERAPARESRPQDAYVDAARALVAHGQPEQALDVLDAGLERHPAETTLLVARGDVLAEQGFRRAAERDYLEALDGDPESAELWRRLGEVRLELDLPASANQALRRCNALVPNDPHTESLLARAAWDSGQLEKAWILYTRLLDGPGEPTSELLVDAATLYAEPRITERHPEQRSLAYSWLHRVLARGPDARAHYVRGLLLESDGKLDNAVAAYRSALAIDPDCPGAGSRLALLLLAVEDGDDLVATN